ncbi:hypothetical protein MCAP1_002502 [Malassezia caprae]|uniref:DUF3835 domain-containing protein n=1 Tax=Malassezia caprae TaxID=1381934 RepID=A0AAF0IX49_9BASI|nr:hypothetical protein MCAP1_002502 [Malassezia caprae]
MVSEAQHAEAVQPDVVVAARALLTRLKRLRALQDTPLPWDTRTLHVDDRTALAHAHEPREAQAALAAHIDTLEKQMAEYKAQFGAQVREAYAASMRDVLSGSAEAASQDRVLNEEGLPFVDPLEMLPDSPPQTPQLAASAPRPTSNVLGRTPGQVAPFDPTMHGEERQQWMASIFDQLQKEEEAELAKEQTNAETPNVAGLRRGFLQGSKPQEPPKKQVRIVEPHESSGEEETPAPPEPAKVRKVPLGMDPEDAGVQEEAARIVDLLGPEVIRGHPNAERIFAEMEAAQPHMVHKAAPEPPAPTEPAKPAIGDTVIERSADADTRRTPSAGRKLSAFKQRQLERQRSQAAEEETPAPPVGPSISQGLSAIERAGRVDDEQSASRVHAGLPPQIPHARPTKAYAAKLQQRAASAASQDQGGDEEEEVQTPGRRVRFGGEEVHHMDEDEDADATMDHVEDDTDDDDEFHQEPDDDDESMPDDAWTSEDEMLWDSEDEYGPEDLEALKPSMDEHPQDSFWNEDLAREYAEAKARLSLQPQPAAQAPSNEAEDNQEAYGIAPLDASVTDPGRPRVSRFKAARLAGERVPDPNGDTSGMERPLAQTADERGHDLAHELHEGRTPVMVLPSLAPVRFPRPTDGDTHGVDLDGESDEDDERLHALMRARLSMEGAPEQGRQRSTRPPQVGRAT